MRYKDFQNASYIAIFGSLWGLNEILLGNFLHLFDVPFKGTIMSGIACVICLVGGKLLPTKEKFPIIAMGIIAIILRLMSFGIFKPHVFISIFTLAILVQLVVNIFGYNRLSFIMAGILASFSPYISALIFAILVYGNSIIFLYHGFLKDHNAIGVFVHGGFVVILLLLFVNILIGMLSGIAAFYLEKEVQNVDNT